MPKRCLHGLFALLLLSFLFARPAHSREDEIPSKSLSPQEHHPKIESALLLRAQTLTTSPSTFQGEGGRRPGEGLSVILEVAGHVDEAQLRALGVEILSRSRRLIRARVDAQNLRALAEQVASISYIRKPLSMVTLGLRRTEGLVPTGALLLQSAGFRGQNVKVAVIDLGFAGLARAKKAGALNPAMVVDEEDYSREGLETGTSHGTGVAEIVHAMAPQAWLYLKKVSDEVDLENAVDDAIAQGIQIINHSVGVANANFNDGTGIVAEIADRARAHGILWVNAAGNHAQSHWMGSFQDRDHNRWLEFAPGREELYIRTDFPGAIELYLTWDDWPRSREDFDLFLYDAQGRLVASSQNYQTGYEQPTEEIQYVAWTPGVYRARILARHVSRSDMRLKLFDLSQHSVEPNIPEGSILTPADARGALAVGAISARLWKSGPQEPYSSQGPTSDGRIKPDLIGPDAVANYTFAYFTGTSASAPHVAGAAALLLSQHPHWTADQLQSYLEAQAMDMGEPSKDNIYGAGRLDLSLGTISARRTISTSTPGRVRPGETVNVKIEATMPPGLFGGLVVREKFPLGWELTGTGGAPDAQCLLKSDECIWPLVKPGESRQFSYFLRVPNTVQAGTYRWQGTINGLPIAGDESLIVEASEEELPQWQQMATSSHLRFTANSPSTARLKIFDLRGRLLFDETTNDGILEWRHRRRANGVYLYVVEILQENRIIQRKLGKVVVLK